MISFLSMLVAHPVIPLFLIVNLAIGIWAHTKAKKNSFEDYALASRSLPTGVLVMTLLATRIGGGDLADPDYTFKYGIIQALVGGAFVLSFFFTGTFVAPSLIYFPKCITTGDLMGKFYGRFVKIATGILGCIFSVLIISSQIEAIGSISQELLCISATHAILLFGFLVLCYSVWSGMRAVSYTDVFQIIAALVVLGYIAQAVMQKVGGDLSLQDLPGQKGLFFDHPKFFYKIKSAIVWGILPTYILTPPVVQRMLMTQDKRQVRQMWYLGGFIYALVLGLLLVIGLGAIKSANHIGLQGTPSNVLLHLVKLFSVKDSLARYLISLGLLGILLSTIDSYLHAIGVSLVQDIISPLKEVLSGKSIRGSSKMSYAKIGCTFMGIVAIWSGITGESSLLENVDVHKIALIVISMILIPLIIGVMGIKTDTYSLMSFLIVYVVSTCTLSWQGGHVKEKFNDSFLFTLLLATLAYFLTHIYIHRGIVTLKRSKATISERLWMPTWSSMVQSVKGWLWAPLRWHIIASKKIGHTPAQSLSFSMVLFALYTFSSIITHGGANDLGLANFMAGIHGIGIALCVGLMLEMVWPVKLKPYFALYWFFTLFYCLVFGNTLAFLRAHGGRINGVQWLSAFIFLAALVDSASFLGLTVLGCSLAFGGWYMVKGAFPIDLWQHDVNLIVLVLLFVLMAGVFLFGRKKERYAQKRLYLNEAFSRAITHESTQPLTEISVLSGMHHRMVHDLASMENKEGEKGFWISAHNHEVMERNTQQIGKAVQEVKNEFSRFNQLLGKEIGGLAKEKVSMRSLIESIIPTLSRRLRERIAIQVKCTQDFQPTLIRSLFPNLLTNLLKNAYLHGNATQMRIHIDGEQGKLYIQDNGRGIPEEVLPYVFDFRFTTGGQASSGIGLALAKIILEASDGKISCRSRHGDKDSFTEFVLEFPQE